MRRLFRFWRAYGDAIGMLGLALALFAVATNTQTGWLFLFCAFILAALGLHFGYGWAELRGVEVRLLRVRAEGGRVRVGEDCFCTLVVTAPKARLFYPVLLLVPPQPFENQVAKPRYFAVRERSQEVSCQIHCRRRGPVAPGEVEVTVQSWAPFAWVTTQRRIRVVHDEFLVFPSSPAFPVELAAPPGSRDGQQSSGRRLGVGGDLRALRDYASGDDLRWVHWPSSARLGRLQLREQNQLALQSLDLYFDVWTASLAEESFEKMVSWAAALLEWAPRQGLEVSLHFNPLAGAFTPCLGDPLEALARVRAAGQTAEALVLPTGTGHLAMSLRGRSDLPQVWNFADPSGLGPSPERAFRVALGARLR